MQRIKTGIPGLDGLIEGGFPHPSSILITGEQGTGKTIFALQFLYNGAVNGEPGLMINIEGFPQEIQWYAERFKWDVAGLQKKNLLLFSSYDPIEFEKFELRTLHSEIILQLSRVITDLGAKRVVIDSLAPLAQSIGSKSKYRTLLYYLSKALKEKGCTALFVTERTGEYLTDFNVEPFVVDGVIELSMAPRGDVLDHTLTIRKMVATKFSVAKYLLDISDEGLRLATGYY